MGWFSHKKKQTPPPEVAQEDVWVVCPSCKAHVYREEWEKNLKTCDRCSFHERLTSAERVAMLLDPKSYMELNPRITFSDPLKFVDAKGSYADKAAETSAKTGLKEAVITGIGRLCGRKIVLAVMDFRFMGGSLASGTGEKIRLAAEAAIHYRYPFVIVAASGGARMHEGIVSLMQMPKTCAAIARLREARLPYISIMTDPTTGGVSASFAMVGDVHIAEPRALIGFAGRRVIEETIKQKLPEDFQTAEYLLAHGFVDMIVPRPKLRDTLHQILAYRRT